MVVDLKQFELEKEIHDDALWVVEQIPGLVAGADQTDILRTGELKKCIVLIRKTSRGFKVWAF